MEVFQNATKYCYFGHDSRFPYHATARDCRTPNPVGIYAGPGQLVRHESKYLSRLLLNSDMTMCTAHGPKAAVTKELRDLGVFRGTVLEGGLIRGKVVEHVEVQEDGSEKPTGLVTLTFLGVGRILKDVTKKYSEHVARADSTFTDPGVVEKKDEEISALKAKLAELEKQSEAAQKTEPEKPKSAPPDRPSFAQPASRGR